MHAQIEILASLQTVDREIKEQTGRKQRLLDELRVTEKQIQSKNRCDKRNLYRDGKSARRKRPDLPGRGQKSDGQADAHEPHQKHQRAAGAAT